MKPRHGTGSWYYEVFTMSPVELQARIDEKKQHEREKKLKYRGVTYYKKTHTK